MTITRYRTSDMEQFVNEALSTSESLFKGLYDVLGKQPYSGKIISNVSAPPYNIYRPNKNTEILEVSLAGFSKEQVNVYTKENTVHVEADTKINKTNEYLNHGFATNKVTAWYTLNEGMEVKDVKYENGLLTVTINKVVPDPPDKKVWL